MQRSGGVVIPMKFLIGDNQILEAMPKQYSKEPFSTEILEFCKSCSRELLKFQKARNYPDIVTLGFWLRKSSLEMMKKRFYYNNEYICLGRGVIFHVAPSNVPVNFAYSLFSGLICGNANVVRVPSKDFRQVSIIIDVLKRVLEQYPQMTSYICLLRYGHEQEINDYLSSLCDVRVIWGGDTTIREVRKSSLPPRATEVCFADRFSLAVIDAAMYAGLSGEEKKRIARAFYNDTYLTDQNACTSPKLVIWIREADEKNSVAEVRKEFWTRLWDVVEKEYVFQDIQGVDKLTQKYLLAAVAEGDIKEGFMPEGVDNRLVCVEITNLTENLADYFMHSGYFLEYVTSDLSELMVLGRDNRCQTVGYLGDKEKIFPLLATGVKGIDRVVPIGNTMDFDLVWDGYDLYERFTRRIVI